MPAFAYSALDAQGLTVHGTVEAEHPRGARSHLRQQNLIPLSVEAVDGASAAGASRLWRRRVLGAGGLAVWTRQLAGLVSAGLPLERALASFAHESDGAGMRLLLSRLKSRVQAVLMQARITGLLGPALSDLSVDDAVRVALASP